MLLRPLAAARVSLEVSAARVSLEVSAGRVPLETGSPARDRRLLVGQRRHLVGEDAAGERPSSPRA